MNRKTVLANQNTAHAGSLPSISLKPPIGTVVMRKSAWVSAAAAK
jgi:hypothetical protein